MLNRRRRYGEKGSRRWLTYAFILIFALLVFWLLLSLIQGKNPMEVIETAFKKDETVVTTEQESKLQKVIEQQQKTIDSLQYRIDVMEGIDGLQKATVNVAGSHLNVRTSASIAAPLAFKINAGKEVNILEYDDHTYVLDGRTGQWCKIIYMGNEGWVWANYLEIIDE